MPLSVEGRPSQRDAVATIHAALDSGVNLLDTADSYHEHRGSTGDNERLVRRAVQGRRDEVIVATKGGHTRPDGRWELDGRPEHLRAACEGSLRALGTDRIDLYQLHRPDPAVPLLESVGALADLQAEGKIRFVGVSNVDAGQIRAAAAIAEVAAVQNELSLSYREPLENGEVAVCEELGIPLLAWAPLGGAARAKTQSASLKRVAERLGVSAQRLALAWLLHANPSVVPIPGARRPATIQDSVAAATLRLTADELTELAV